MWGPCSIRLSSFALLREKILHGGCHLAQLRGLGRAGSWGIGQALGAELWFQICLLLTGCVILGPISLAIDRVRWDERGERNSGQSW